MIAARPSAFCLHAPRHASRHRSFRLRSLPRHDDLGRAEHRSRGPRAARLRVRARRELRGHRRDVPGAAAGGDAGPHRGVPRRLAREAAARARDRRDEGRRSRTARLDPQRAHRPHARRRGRSLRHEPRAPAHRAHRPLPDPLAAAQRADVRGGGLRPDARACGAGDRGAGRRDGRAGEGRQDPPLGVVERDGVGHRRVRPRRARAGRSAAGDRAEQLQPAVPHAGARRGGGAASREHAPARVQPARRRLSHRQVPRRGQAGRHALRRVRQLRHDVPQADGPGSDGGVRGAGAQAGNAAPGPCARLRAQPLVRGRDHRRRDEHRPARRRHPRRAGEPRVRSAGGDRAGAPALSQSRAGGARPEPAHSLDGANAAYPTAG
jgi:hypothetical protein